MTFISALCDDLRVIPTTNAYRKISRLRVRLQEGRKKVLDYENMYRDNLTLQAMAAFSADMDQFDAELTRIERSLDDAEDRQEPLPVVQSTPAAPPAHQEPAGPF